MPGDIKLTSSLAPRWQSVQEIRTAVENALAGYGREIEDAGKMVASELVENAVKQWDAVRDAPAIAVALSANGTQIEIAVTSRLGSAADARRLKNHIDRLKADRQSASLLYRQRIREIMENPEQSGTRLGLFRIVCEGQFRLAYRFNENAVTVTAIRMI
ncbi:hypothetical protein DENIS_2842 [Desulfonema ishimotonii]|uniref:ATP-binding protein n=1 Tax=Desulfonema ishimotonii TaxID=45657 RepID=A0A401FY43_9BACT|nr:hypothetical protein [Desulfonema ishimotonii]GBC61880.1 hypothetical protein DENIS_2842 [Desulfonema ishimotonii]